MPGHLSDKWEHVVCLIWQIEPTDDGPTSKQQTAMMIHRGVTPTMIIWTNREKKYGSTCNREMPTKRLNLFSGFTRTCSCTRTVSLTKLGPKKDDTQNISILFSISLQLLLVCCLGFRQIHFENLFEMFLRSAKRPLHIFCPSVNLSVQNDSLPALGT